MQAEDILDTTHQLEGKGMTRLQAEAIAKALATAVQPLATRKELAAAVEPLATKMNLEVVVERLGMEIKTLREKDLKAAEERLGADMVILFEKTNNRIESTKLWLLGGLLAMALSITFHALQVGSASGGVRSLETGQPIRQPPETTQSAISDQTNL